MLESFFADPHSSATGIVLNAQSVAVGAAVDVQIQFDVLYVTILNQRYVAGRELVLDSASPRNEVLDPAQCVQYRGLSAAVRPQQNVRLVELQLEVDEAPKIVDVESRHHGGGPEKKAGGTTGAAGVALHNPDNPNQNRHRYGRLNATHWPGTSRPPIGTTMYCLPSCR